VIITIYRSDRSIWALPVRPDDAPVFHWSAYEFGPRPFAMKDGASFRKLRLESVAVRIASSLPAKLVGEGKHARLSVWWSPKGIDAESAYHVARSGEKGLRIDGTGLEDSMDASYVQPLARLHQG
jgi:hypothetical protein